MKEIESSLSRLERLVQQIKAYIEQRSEEDLEKKWDPKRWSKKELLGHLVDSGINNLQRFTEIQYAEKPFQIKAYAQDELVVANHYQDSETEEILQLLQALNRRISRVIELQNEESLAYPVLTPDGKSVNLKYLIEDYLVHFAHHTKQICEAEI